MAFFALVFVYGPLSSPSSTFFRSATDITPVAAEADNENVAADSDSDVVTVDDNTVIAMDYTETTIKAYGSIDGATTAVV